MGGGGVVVRSIEAGGSKYKGLPRVQLCPTVKEVPGLSPSSQGPGILCHWFSPYQSSVQPPSLSG